MEGWRDRDGGFRGGGARKRRGVGFWEFPDIFTDKRHYWMRGIFDIYHIISLK